MSPAARSGRNIAPTMDGSRANIDLSATVLEGSYTNNSISTPLYSDPNRQYLNIQSPKPNGTNGLNSTANTHESESQIVNPVASYTSPWREHSLQAQVEAASFIQDETKRTTERRLDALRSDVTRGSDEIHHKDMQLLWYAARKDTATADTHKYLQDASDKLERLEEEDAKVRVATEEINRTILNMQQDLQEARDSMARAEKRSHELCIERQELQTSLKGIEAEIEERQQVDADFKRHSNEGIAQLQGRLTALTEEVEASHMRLAAREAALASSRTAAQQEVTSLQEELAKYKHLQKEMEDRNRNLTQQLKTTKEEFTRAAEDRRQKTSQNDKRRADAQRREVERANADCATSSRKFQEESNNALTLLQEELKDYRARLVATRSDNESLMEEVRQQDILIAQLEAANAGKQDAEVNCKANEAMVVELVGKRESVIASMEGLNRDIARGQDQIMLLEAEASRLTDLTEEEGKLKRYVASISSEIAASTEMQSEENRQNAEKEEAMSEEHTRLLQEAAELDGELQRIRATNATRLDALSRKLHSSRGNMLDRERTLDDLVAKNTQLQSTIIEYEEAKRRMEREALQKKESAARAAKNALKDLE